MKSTSHFGTPEHRGINIKDKAHAHSSFS